MLPSLGPNCTHKKPRYQLILSRDNGDQGILQSDWTKDTPDQIQPKVVVSDDTIDDYPYPKKYIYQFISSRGIDDQLNLPRLK